MEVITSERVQIWVCLFLYGWYYPGVRLQIWVCLICVISPYSNGAVQIQVGLEISLNLSLHVFWLTYQNFISRRLLGPGGGPNDELERRFVVYMLDSHTVGPMSCKEMFWCAGTTPSSEEKKSENAWANDNLSCGFP